VLLGISDAAMAGMRPATEANAWLAARTARELLATTWAIGETGAAGPTRNRYGDAAGHSSIAIAGAAEHVVTVETGSTDRYANMCAFTADRSQTAQGDRLYRSVSGKPPQSFGCIGYLDDD
jgi:nicotinamide-nucleotide amidase